MSAAFAGSLPPMSFFRELKRRNVFRVATAYLIGAWLVIQVLATIGPYVGMPAWLMPVILVLLALGFGLTCLLSWIYDITPSGAIVRTQQDNGQSSPPEQTIALNANNRKFDRAIIALLVAALVWLLVDKFWITTTTTTTTTTSSPTSAIEQALIKTDELDSKPSIAVLPFANMSNDPEQEYFSDGLAEELLNGLARINHLKVAARTSSFFFKGKNIDIRDIAQQLNVAHILEGSVRKFGTQIRVTVQLIEAKTGYHLWSGTYDFEITDLFKIQDQVSAAVIEQLQVTLLDGELREVQQTGTRNIEAYDAYLLGRFHLRSRSSSGMNKAVAFFRRSLEADSNNELAHSGLADAYLLLWSYGKITHQEYLEQVAPLMGRFPHPKTAEMLTSKGAYLAALDNIDAAIATYLQAIELNPNYVLPYNWLHSHFSDVGQDNKADEYLARALELDPMSSILLSNLGLRQIDAGELEKAEQTYLRIFKTTPGSPKAAEKLLNLYQSKGEWSKAWALTQRTDLEPDYEWSLRKIFFWMMLGEFYQAEQEASRLMQVEPNQLNQRILMVYQVSAWRAGLIPKQIPLDTLQRNTSEFNNAYAPLDAILFGWLLDEQDTARKLALENYTPLLESEPKIANAEQQWAMMMLLNITKVDNPSARAWRTHLLEYFQPRLKRASWQSSYWSLALTCLESPLQASEDAMQTLKKKLQKGIPSSFRLFPYSPLFTCYRAHPDIDEVMAMVDKKVSEIRAQIGLEPLSRPPTVGRQ
ncbi:hypothetical protein [Paraglaciecola aestuariivivens]